MTGALWQTVMTTIVGVLLGAYIKRALRLHRERLERMLEGMEGAVAAQTKRLDPKDYRKGFGAVAGVLLSGLLIWASTDGVLAELEQALLPVVPGRYRSLIGWAIGGVAIVVAVVKSRNGAKPVASDAPATLPEPAPPAAADPVSLTTDGDAAAAELPPAGAVPASSAVAAPAPVAVTTTADDVDQPAPPKPFWAGVTPREPVASTSLVDLRPVPRSSPL